MFEQQVLPPSQLEYAPQLPFSPSGEQFESKQQFCTVSVPHRGLREAVPAFKVVAMNPAVASKRRLNVRATKFFLLSSITNYFREQLYSHLCRLVNGKYFGDLVILQVGCMQ
jgi:hypothetical protein